MLNYGDPKKTLIIIVKNLIIFGAGGHAISCLDVINSTNKFKVKGYISKKENKNLSKKIRWLGDDQYIKKIKKTDYAIIAFANIGKKNLVNRIRIYNKLKKQGCKLPVIKSTNSYISKKAKIDSGTIIMHGVVINSNVKIGKNCIVNSKSLIEHDTTVGDHCHISTGVIINGNCKILDETFLGSGSIILNNITSKKKIISSGEIIKK